MLAAILSGPVDRSLRRPELLSADGIQKNRSRRRSGVAAVLHCVAGVWLGLCLAFKPSLLWCGVMWLGPMIWVAIQSREFRASISKPLIAAIAGGVLGGTIAVAFSAIWFPLHCWIEWVQAVSSLPDEIIQTEQGNYSLTYFVRSYGVPAWSVAKVGPVLGIGLSLIEGRRLLSRVVETRLETRSTEIADSAVVPAADRASARG